MFSCFYFKSQSTWICGFSILILNYNCALTSYKLYFAEAQFSTKNVETLSVTLSVVLGLFVGQMVFGLIGDTLGRERAFCVCVSIMFLGSFFSIFVGSIPIVSGLTKPLFEFGVFRAVYGVGAGGLYHIILENLREQKVELSASHTIAFIFGPFGSLGLILAPVMGWILTLLV